MPACCVKTCRNRSEKGFRLFRLPQGDRNAKRKQKWLDLIGRKNIPERAVVCEVHFGDDQFERNRLDGRKLLRFNAVPNLLLAYEIEDQKETNNVEDVNCSHDIEKSDDSCELGENNDKNTNCNDINCNHKCCNIDNTEIEVTSIESICEQRNEKYINNAKILLKTELRRSNALRKKLQRHENHFNKMFNEDQIRFMENGSYIGMVWSKNTINKALRLYIACGQKGYEEVLRQKLPYPNIRTIQNHIQDLILKPDILEVSEETNCASK